MKTDRIPTPDFRISPGGSESSMLSCTCVYVYINMFLWYAHSCHIVDVFFNFV